MTLVSSRVRNALTASLFCLLLPAVDAQTNPPPNADEIQKRPVLKANTRLVIVDVVATDSKGTPIRNLTADDFNLMEDGISQKLSSFSFQQASIMGPQAVPQLPPNVFSNVPSVKSTSLTVILVDALNGQFASRAYARDALIKYLGNREGIQPTAVYVLEKNLKLLHDFTGDAGALKEALAAFKPEVTGRMDDVNSAASPFNQRGDYQMSELNIEISLRALNSLAQALKGYPGRKNLIWMSEAFPINLYPEALAGGSSTSVGTLKSAVKGVGGGGAAAGPAIDVAMVSSNGKGWKDYADLVRKVADALMSAQVAVYPIDIAGVGRISRWTSLATMRDLAERTGGETFANQNDLGRSLSSSLDDSSSYYTLTYYPDNKQWDGRFRKIEIRSARPDAKLRYRQGYYALDPDLDSPKKTDNKKLSMELTQALALDVPSATAVLFRATIAPPENKDSRIVVNFAIDPHTLKFDETSDGAEHASVSCALVAFSAKGSPVKEELNNMTGKVQPAEFPKLMRGSFPCQITTELKSGKYRLRLGVVDRNSQLIGTTTATVTVP